MDSSTQEKLQKTYYEMHLLGQQIKQVQQQLQTIDSQLEELDKTADSVESLNNIRKGSEIFVSISPGIFAKAEITDTENLLLNVGAGTGVQKSVPDTVALIREQISEIGAYREKMTEQLELLTHKGARFEKEMEELGKKG